MSAKSTLCIYIRQKSNQMRSWSVSQSANFHEKVHKPQKVNLKVTHISWIWIQWNLDLRKILGVTKIFLKSRFFLISNTRRNPWKSITLQNEHLKQYKYLIALTLSNASDYICGYFHIFWLKLGKYEKKILKT